MQGSTSRRSHARIGWRFLAASCCRQMRLTSASRQTFAGSEMGSGNGVGKWGRSWLFTVDSGKGRFRRRESLFGSAANNPERKTRLQCEIEATDRRIDQLVYELYGPESGHDRGVEKGGRQGFPNSWPKPAAQLVSQHLLSALFFGQAELGYTYRRWAYEQIDIYTSWRTVGCLIAQLTFLTCLRHWASQSERLRVTRLSLKGSIPKLPGDKPRSRPVSAPQIK